MSLSSDPQARLADLSTSALRLASARELLVEDARRLSSEFSKLQAPGTDLLDGTAGAEEALAAARARRVEYERARLLVIVALRRQSLAARGIWARAHAQGDLDVPDNLMDQAKELMEAARSLHRSGEPPSAETESAARFLSATARLAVAPPAKRETRSDTLWSTREPIVAVDPEADTQSRGDTSVKLSTRETSFKLSTRGTSVDPSQGADAPAPAPAARPPYRVLVLSIAAALVVSFVALGALAPRLIALRTTGREGQAPSRAPIAETSPAQPRSGSATAPAPGEPKPEAATLPGTAATRPAPATGSAGAGGRSAGVVGGTPATPGAQRTTVKIASGAGRAPARPRRTIATPRTRAVSPTRPVAAAGPPPPRIQGVLILLRSSPSGAQVYIGGAYQGTTPLWLDQRPRALIPLTLRRGNLSWRGVVQADAWGNQVLVIRLTPPRAVAAPARSPTAAPRTGSATPTPARPTRPATQTPSADVTVAPARQVVPAREHFEGLMRQGVQMYRAGWYGPAMAKFKQASAIVPNSPRVHLWIARAAFKAGRLGEARRALARVIGLAPGSEWAVEAEKLLRLVDHTEGRS